MMFPIEILMKVNRKLCIAVPFMKIKRFTMNVYSESILRKTAEKKD